MIFSLYIVLIFAIGQMNAELLLTPMLIKGIQILATDPSSIYLIMLPHFPLMRVFVIYVRYYSVTVLISTNAQTAFNTDITTVQYNNLRGNEVPLQQLYDT